MAYDETLPTPRDRIRHRLGDIFSPPLRMDVEYDALITQYGETEALIHMAESLASEYAQNPSSVSVGGISVSYSTLVSNWQAIAKTARDALTQLGRGSSVLISGTVQRDGMTGLKDAEYRRSMDDAYRDDWDGPVW